MAERPADNPISILEREIRTTEERLKQLNALREAHRSFDAQLREILSEGRTGNARSNGRSSTPSPRSGRKRKRLPGVTIEWIADTLKKRPLTVKQLQQAADKAGYSGLRIAQLLKEGKFTSAVGEKQAGVKGKPAAVWNGK